MSEPGPGRQVWDVAVIGAGPAGACAALAVLATAPDARVLLLDRAEFPRDKVCGDGIAPHVLDVVRGRMNRPVWVIPRETFDARLVDHAVAAGRRWCAITSAAYARSRTVCSWT